jgi:hypothetical protein
MMRVLYWLLDFFASFREEHRGMGRVSQQWLSDQKYKREGDKLK